MFRINFGSYLLKKNIPPFSLHDRTDGLLSPVYDRLLLTPLSDEVYFSPILDLYNGEIIAYNIENRRTYTLVSKMLDKLLPSLSPILHSDQGWHYQMKQYSYALKQHGITHSMSRKGNCLDNAVMENFFGLLKSELLYLLEFDSMEHFKVELEQYIDYYNYKHLRVKLKD